MNKIVKHSVKKDSLMFRIFENLHNQTLKNQELLTVKNHKR